MRGSSLVEALVAMALAAVVVGGLTAAMVTNVAALARARTDAAAVALAIERLESLRAGPRADGTDTPIGSDGTPYVRAWRVRPGRGRPDRLQATIDWNGHRVTLATEAWP